MKILYLFLILFLISSINNYSQQLKYGIKIGMVTSNIGMTDMPESHINVDKPDIWRHDFNLKTGFNISAVAGFHIDPDFYFAIEPGYVLKGAAFDASESKLDLHYLNLPLVIKYNFTDKFGIYAGPEFSKLLSANLTHNGRLTDLGSFYSVKMEVSIFIGIEYRIISSFEIGIRYNQGLSKVSETVWSDADGNIDSICKENNSYLLIYGALSINDLISSNN